MINLLYNFGLVDLDELDTEDIDTVSVAQALSRLYRFNGNFGSISVAQHELVVSQLVKQMGGTPEQQMAALHHDDAECFIGDVPSPVKGECDAYCDFDKAISVVIGDKYGIDLDDDLVHLADAIVGTREIHFHMDRSPLMPRLTIKLPPRYREFRIGQEALTDWGPPIVLSRYLARHDELMLEMVEAYNDGVLNDDDKIGHEEEEEEENKWVN